MRRVDLQEVGLGNIEREARVLLFAGSQPRPDGEGGQPEPGPTDLVLVSVAKQRLPRQARVTLATQRQPHRRKGLRDTGDPWSRLQSRCEARVETLEFCAALFGQQRRKVGRRIAGHGRPERRRRQEGKMHATQKFLDEHEHLLGLGFRSPRRPDDDGPPPQDTHEDEPGEDRPPTPKRSAPTPLEDQIVPPTRRTTELSTLVASAIGEAAVGVIGWIRRLGAHRVALYWYLPRGRVGIGSDILLKCSTAPLRSFYPIYVPPQATRPSPQATPIARRTLATCGPN